MTALEDVRHFLALKRIAVVGVSRNPGDFTRTLFRELLRRGYDAIPVNPNLAEAEGVASRASVSEISPPAEGALLMTSPAATAAVVRECAAAGIRNIWMYRAVGSGAVSAEAVEWSRANGLRVVAGECPFLYFPQTPWVHRFHGFCRRMVGSYPR